MNEPMASTEEPSHHAAPTPDRRRRSKRRSRRRSLARALGRVRHAADRITVLLAGSSADHALLGLIGASVLVCALALGGARIDWLLGSAPLPLATALVGIWHWRGKLPLVAIALWALAAFSALQAMPIPVTVLQRISPVAAQIWYEAFDVIGARSAAWASVSLDPRASLVEAFKWALYGGIFVAAGSYARKHGVASIALIVFASSVAVTAVGICHGLVGARLLYGFYQPTFQPPPFGIAPLLNPNNLAGYLNLGIFAGLGLMLSRQRQVPRAPVALGLCILVAYNVIAASRAGLVALALGCLALVALEVISWVRSERSRRERRSPITSLLIVVAVPIVGLLLATLGGTSETWSELTNKSLVKLEAIASARHLVADFPWVGTGRGAFESVFPAYRELKGHVVFHLAESFPVQWASEWGLPVSTIALLFLASQLRPGRLRCFRSRLTSSLFIGVLVFLLQNLLDLALELLGVAVALWAVLGALWGESARPDEPGSTETARWRRGSRVGLGLCMISLFGVSALWGRQDVTRDRALLSQAYQWASHQGRPEAFAAVLARAQEAVGRHPADPFPPLVASLAARHVPDVDPLPWVAYALKRDTVAGRNHLALAKILFDRGLLKQALLELRLAHEAEPALLIRALRLAVAWTKRDPDLVWRVIGDQDPSVGVLLRLAQAEPISSAIRLAALDRALEKNPRSLEANQMAVETLLSDLGSNKSHCATLGEPECIARIRKYCQRIQELRPNDTVAVELVARLDSATGDPGRAVRTLSEACERHQSSLSCWRLLVNLAARASEFHLLESAAKEYLGVACADRNECPRAAIWLGRLFERAKLWNSASTYYSRALSDTTTTEAWLSFAKVTWLSGQPNRALAALTQAERYAHNGSSRNAIERLRKRITHSQLNRK